MVKLALLNYVTVGSDEAAHWSTILHPYLNAVALVITVLGVVVIAWGVLRGTVYLLQLELGSIGQGIPRKERSALRMDLGYYLLLGLEFLVAGDIIETLMAPDWEHVAVLGGLVIIRTLISVSLNWELGREAAETSESS